MKHGLRSGIHNYVLYGLIEAGSDDCHGIFAKSDGVERELASGVGVGGGGPVGGFRAQHDHGIFHRAMLRIVDYAANRSKDRGKGGQRQERRQPDEANATHKISSENLGAECHAGTWGFKPSVMEGTYRSAGSATPPRTTTLRPETRVRS